MTKTKIKKDGINITIENNLFSKNKTSEKKEQEDDDIDDGGSGLPPPNPFEAEPAFLGEIRNHMAEKRFYNMRINPVRPSYNDMNMVHQNFLNEKENVSQEFNNERFEDMPSFDNDDTLFQFEVPKNDTSAFFNERGEYISKNPSNALKTVKQRTRNSFLRYEKKPHKNSLKKYGLPDDFLDNWEEKRRKFDERN